MLFTGLKYIFAGFCRNSIIKNTEKDTNSDSQTICYWQDQAVLLTQDQVCPADLPRQTEPHLDRFPETGSKYNTAWLYALHTSGNLS